VAHRAKILLVDDRAENLLALEAILSSLDQELVFVRSGEAAVEAAGADEFAVILLDVVMPGMDGFETAAQIKQRGRTPNVPIIFLTAAGAEPDLAFRGYAAGAVDYISKPFDPWVLRAKVSVFVDLYLKERQLRVVSELSPLLSAIEEAAAGLAGLPAALASGALTDATLTEGLTRLNGAIASLRATLGSLGVKGMESIADIAGFPGVPGTDSSER
jgi:CheY-like chemotaxis protein